MEIVIDKKSGFCFGVKHAVELAEHESGQRGKLYCLGEIVHNSEEVNRLKSKGIEFISRDEFYTLSNCRVMIRAHGEPPATYEYAKKNEIEIIDATCPVVLKLQEKVRNVKKLNPSAQVVIYGKTDHPEVVGLRGQVDEVIIVGSLDDINTIDFTRPVSLFAQTTKDRKNYKEIKDEILERLLESGRSSDDFVVFDSICGQVANRAPWLEDFSKSVETVVFVGGKNSSNSKMLFGVCKNVNPDSHFVTNAEEANSLNLKDRNKVGICGATSTPLWLIEEVAEVIKSDLK
jgi:4-hydroxy-3-methylbut-2-enyl diphosphate reductase